MCSFSHLLLFFTIGVTTDYYRSRNSLSKFSVKKLKLQFHEKGDSTTHVFCGTLPVAASVDLQSFIKHLREALLFMPNSEYRKRSNSVIQKSFSRTGKAFIRERDWPPGNSSMKVWALPDFFWFLRP